MVPDQLRVMTGTSVSMLLTVAIVVPVFPEASVKVNVKVPFCVKVCVMSDPLCVTPVALVTVIDSDAPVRVARTTWFVGSVVE